MKYSLTINPSEYILIDSSKQSRIDMLNIMTGDILIQEYSEGQEMKYYRVDWKDRDNMDGTPNDYKLGKFLGYSDFDLGDTFFEGTNKQVGLFTVKF